MNSLSSKSSTQEIFVEVSRPAADENESPAPAPVIRIPFASTKPSIVKDTHLHHYTSNEDRNIYQSSTFSSEYPEPLATFVPKRPRSSHIRLGPIRLPRKGIGGLSWSNIIYVAFVGIIGALFILGIVFAYNDHNVFERVSSSQIWKTSYVDLNRFWGPREDNFLEPKNTDIILGLTFTNVQPDFSQVTVAIEPLFVSSMYAIENGKLTKTLVVEFQSTEIRYASGQLYPLLQNVQMLEFDYSQRFLYPYDSYTLDLPVTVTVADTMGTANRTLLATALTLSTTNIGGYLVSGLQLSNATDSDYVQVRFVFWRRNIAKVYPLFITLAMFLLFCVNLSIAYFILFIRAREVEPDLVAGYFGAIFAIPQLRMSQPGVPADFGILVDWVGFYWCISSCCLVLVGLAAFYVIQNGFLIKLRRRKEERRKAKMLSSSASLQSANGAASNSSSFRRP